MKKLILILLIFSLFAFIGRYEAKAGYSLTLSLDEMTTEDTIYTCSDLESITLHAPTGATDVQWIHSSPQESVNSSMLELSADISGMIECNYKLSGIDENFVLFFVPFTLHAKEKAKVVCGDSVQLDGNVSMTSLSGLTYNWVPATGLDDPTIQKPYATLIKNSTYVVAVEVQGTCTEYDTVDVTLKPMEAPEICMVGVDSSNKNMIIWDNVLLQNVDSIYIYKETNLTNEYNIVGKQEVGLANYFIDAASNPDVQSNKYKIAYKDQCGQVSYHSKAHKTIHLTINQGIHGEINLIWEPYEGFTINTFNIYRGSNTKELGLIGTASGSTTQYTDNLPPQGLVYYQLEVISPRNCFLLKAASNSASRSNIVKKGGTSSNTGFEELQFELYPNPVNNILSIKISEESFNYEIFGMIGNKITGGIGQRTSQVDVSNLTSGMYFIKISTNKSKGVKRFIVD